MTSTLRTWVISAAAATGVVGGGAVGLAVAAPAHSVPPTPSEAPATVDLSALRSQVQQLLAEDQALHLALAHAKTRLSKQVAVSEASLRAVRSQLVAAQEALTAVRRAAAAKAAAPKQQTAPSHVSRPTTHTSTGASGAGGSTSGESEGGHDD
jgi:hypothetical protein